MLSVVIPTLNAGENLPTLLAQVSGRVDDIIISDGGSVDDTISIALAAGARLAVGCKGRGWQLARGARWAYDQNEKQQWLVFIHADSLLSVNWQNAVKTHIENYPDKAGYFRFKINDKGWQPWLMERIVALRCRFWQLPYGDQGLLISRKLYEEIGGFPNWELFEDVKIIEALRGRIRPMIDNIYSDGQKYKTQGYWRRSVNNFKLYRAYKNGASQDSLFKSYYP